MATISSIGCDGRSPLTECARWALRLNMTRPQDGWLPADPSSDLQLRKLTPKLAQLGPQPRLWRRLCQPHRLSFGFHANHIQWEERFRTSLTKPLVAPCLLGHGADEYRGMNLLWQTLKVKGH